MKAGMRYLRMYEAGRLVGFDLHCAKQLAAWKYSVIEKVSIDEGKRFVDSDSEWWTYLDKRAVPRRACKSPAVTKLVRYYPCLACSGTGFLNPEDIPVEHIVKVVSDRDSDKYDLRELGFDLCPCCSDGKDWHERPGKHSQVRGGCYD